MKRPPNISDLYVVRIAENVGGVATDEESVRLAIERVDQLRNESLSQQVRADLLLARLVQQSILFVVDRDTMVQAVESLAPGWIELPPLPFPDVLIEGDGPPWAILDRDTREWLFSVHHLWVQEVQRGARWDGAFFLQKAFRVRFPQRDGTTLEDHPIEVLLFELTPDQVTFRNAHGSTDGVNYPLSDPLPRFALEAIHFITARGVSLATIKPSRQVRRNAQRKGVVLPERLYWVHIKDELINRIGGDGMREFHCRWLVRGHWRRLDAERKTWIKPYIKGPPGAPWRGRPVYHVPAA